MSFYEGLLDWKFRQMENSTQVDYVMVEVDGVLIGGLRKVPSSPAAISPLAPILYFTVDKLTEKIIRAKELGAKILGDITDLGKDRGRYQWIQDREGHLIGLWSRT
jgi:predicted enzyme related to lactoylglutathione lyase